MKTRILILIVIVFGTSSLLFATTGDKDKNGKESTRKIESYELRTEIMTEFNLENAKQIVDLNLSPDYEYQFVAIGDEDISNLEIEIKNSKRGDWEKVATGKKDQSMSVYEFEPKKSGTYQFSIKVNEFTSNGKGFVTFMVLRK